MCDQFIRPQSVSFFITQFIQLSLETFPIHDDSFFTISLFIHILHAKISVQFNSCEYTKKKLLQQRIAPSNPRRGKIIQSITTPQGWNFFYFINEHKCEGNTAGWMEFYMVVSAANWLFKTVKAILNCMLWQVFAHLLKLFCTSIDWSKWKMEKCAFLNDESLAWLKILIRFSPHFGTYIFWLV